MDLKPQNKKERIALGFIIIFPLICYGIVLRKNNLYREYLATFELTEEGKKEIERLNAEYEKEHPELDFLYYDNLNHGRN